MGVLVWCYVYSFGVGLFDLLSIARRVLFCYLFVIYCVCLWCFALVLFWVV